MFSAGSRSSVRVARSTTRKKILCQRVVRSASTSSASSPPPAAASNSGTNKSSQQQQQALHNEISGVMGKKTATALKNSPPFIPPSRPAVVGDKNHRRNVAITNGVFTFSLLVLSAQALKSGMENRRLKEEMEDLETVNEGRLKALETLFSQRTVQTIAERIASDVAKLRGNDAANQNQQRSFWFGSSVKGVAKSTSGDNEQSGSSLYANIVEQELLRLIKESKALDAEQKRTYELNILKKSPSMSSSSSSTSSAAAAVSGDNTVEESAILNETAQALLLEEPHQQSEVPPSKQNQQQNAFSM